MATDNLNFIVDGQLPVVAYASASSVRDSCVRISGLTIIKDGQVVRRAISVDSLTS